MRTPISLLALTCTLALAGCVGYTTWPPANGQLASGNLNAPPAAEVMIESLQWVINNHPPEGRGSVAVNLPPTVQDRTYAFIAEQVGPGAVAMAPGRENLPTYHVTRVWVRGQKAEVDVLRPVQELGDSPTGRPIIQAVTIHLEGGFRTWRVERTRHWVIGAEEVPGLHYHGVPEPEDDEPQDPEADTAPRDAD